MAVVIETTLGDIVVDLFVKERPKSCLNFLKLAKLKYYNYNLFHTIEPGFIAQTGDPTGTGNGGSSVWGLIEGTSKRFFEAEVIPKIKHTEPGLLSMVGDANTMIGSQFFFTLGPDLASLDGKHCVIGEVTEGHEILRKIGEAICDENHRPYQDIRITHTVVLEDPYSDPRGFREPSRSPSPSKERLQNGRIAADEDIDDTEGKTEAQIQEMLQEREAKARATILEIVGDIPDADIAPPENVLFVCKLNPVTTDDDLKIIFSRFGKIKTCEVIRDKQTGDSLQYAFIEFEERKSCEDAYFKMDNVLIDDRRIHVDFSQSVSKIKWRGKGNYTIIEDSHKYKSTKNVFDNKSSSRSRSRSVRNDRSSGSRRSDEKSVSRRSDDKSGNRSSRYDLGNWKNDYEKYFSWKNNRFNSSVNRNRNRNYGGSGSGGRDRRNRSRSRSPRNRDRERRRDSPYSRDRRDRSHSRSRNRDREVYRDRRDRSRERSHDRNRYREERRVSRTRDSRRSPEFSLTRSLSHTNNRKRKDSTSSASDSSSASSSESESDKKKRKKDKKKKKKSSDKKRSRRDSASSSDSSYTKKKKKSKKSKK